MDNLTFCVLHFQNVCGKLSTTTNDVLKSEVLKDEIGVVNGLAYTSVGGTMLTVEVAVMDGKGNLELTGSLGDVIKEIRVCKKYISMGSMYTAYELLLRAVNNFSMLYLSINGYTVSKDSLAMACNLNDELNDKVHNLLYKEVSYEAIRDVVDYIENYLEYNIEKAAKEIIDFMKNQGSLIGSYDIKNNLLLERLEGVPDEKRTARFVCAIAAAFPDGTVEITRGTIEGQIGYEEKGENGFGYDPIFYLPEYGCTTAELSPEKKNELSHRGNALRAMREIMEKKI